MEKRDSRVIMHLQICSLIPIFLILLRLGTCATSTVSLELSMVNSTVQKGGYFELQAVKFSPSLIKDGFRGIFCGYTQEDGDLSEMTKWGFYKSPPGMKVESTLPPDYTGRVTVRNRVIMRISNAKFIDEGRIFYCKVDYQNLTTGKDLDLRKFAKLETVYVKPKGVGVTNYSCPRMLKLQGLVLLCNFTARPKVNITWIHSNKIKGVKTSVHYGSNGLIASIGIFNITYVDDEDLIYSITCAGENQYGKATQSAMLSVKSKPTKPVEMNIKVDDKSGSAFLCWKKPKCGGLHGIKGYMVYYKIANSNSSFTDASKNPIKCCSYNITKLKRSVIYEVKVVAVGSNGRKGSDSKIKKVEIPGKQEPKPKPQKKSLSAATIAGIAIALIVIVICVIDFCCCFWKKQGLIYCCFSKSCGRSEKGKYEGAKREEESIDQKDKENEKSGVSKSEV